MIRTALAAAVVLALLGITGAMDRYDEERLAEHVAQRDREIARQEALRRQAEWAVLTHKAQRLTGFPEVAGK